MPDARALQSIVDAAEQAAAVEDFPAAERLLRDAAVMQEAQFGPLDAGLVRTFNNLAIACEMAGHPADADVFYRRAYAVAVAALPADDPRTIETRDNLKAFCAARGVAFDLSPATTPPVTAPPSEPAMPSTAAPVSAASTSSSALKTSGLVVAVGVVVFLLARVLGIMAARNAVVPQTTPAIDESSTSPAAPPVALPRERPATRDVVAEPAPSPPPEAVDDTTRREPPPPRPDDAGSLVVVESRLCADLSTGAGAWTCVPATNPAPPGRLWFYTRIAAPAPTRVEHRWYVGDTLFQTVTLAIGASPTAGYRTYSRQTIARERAGAWRVELRSPAGGLLAEERFVVQ